MLDDSKNSFKVEFLQTHAFLFSYIIKLTQMLVIEFSVVYQGISEN